MDPEILTTEHIFAVLLTSWMHRLDLTYTATIHLDYTNYKGKGSEQSIEIHVKREAMCKISAGGK